MSSKLFIGLVTLCLFWPISSLAQNQHGIVAIVGEHAITDIDLKKRIEFIIKTTGLENSEATRRKLAPQALQSMMTEHLQRDEAKALEIDAKQTEVDKAIANIEMQNGIPAGKFRESLRAKGVDEEIFIEQLKVQIMWQRIISRKIVPQITINDADVKAAENTIIPVEKSPPVESRTDIRLSRIVLPIDASVSEKAAKDLAEALANEINKGKDFSTIAKQFEPAEEQEIGWISESQLDTKIANSISNIRTGGITPPMKLDEDYVIFKVEDRRTMTTKSKAPTEPQRSTKDMLLSRAIDRESRKYIRDLKRKAFIEIRLAPDSL